MGGYFLIDHIGNFQIVESEVFPFHLALPFKVTFLLAVSLVPPSSPAGSKTPDLFASLLEILFLFMADGLVLARRTAQPS